MVNKLKLAVIAAGCCLAITACKQAPVQQGVQTFKVITIAPSDEVRTNSYSASIRGRQDIDIYPQVSGKITQLAVEEGSIVRQGQTLFVIDQVPYRMAYETAQANVKAAEAGVATAQLAFDSKKELFEKNVVSEYDLRTTENQLLSAQASLAQAKAQETNARNNLSYTVVTSPVNGVVGTLPFRVGALVGPTLPQPLTTVSDNSEMYVYFSMTENQLLSLTRQFGSKEEALKAMPKVQLRLNDGTIYSEMGVIESISGVVDRQTGAVSIRAAFPNPSRLLHSGSAGNVIIPYETKDAIVIPQSTTFELQDKIFVYRIIDGKTSSTMIQVQPSDDGQRYVVTSGLQVGDVILGEGVALMREGTPITPAQEGASPQPTQEQQTETATEDASEEVQK